jgi:hypothetical protein
VGELSFAIAGLRTGIRTRDPEVAGVVRERYKGFLSAGTPDWRIEMKAKAAPGPSFAGAVVVRRDGDRARFTVRRGDFAGTLDLSQRSGTVTLSDPGEVSIDSFLRITYSLALLDVRGLVVHAASLMRGGKAYLFCGPSGSGKTTVARLSPDATLLSDELSIVRISDTRARCYATPFSGELARAGEDRAAPLVGVYFLHHGSRHAVEAVKPRRALERLLPNVLFFAREADLTGRVLSIAADLVEAVPCFDLSFRLDPDFWEVIDRG